MGGSQGTNINMQYIYIYAHAWLPVYQQTKCTAPCTEIRVCRRKTAAYCLDHKAMLVRNTAPVSIFNPTSSVCASSIQYVICASCTVRQVIHATQSTSWYDLTQYETNHSHLNAALSEFVLLKLPRLLILQQVPTWPQEQKLFISLGPTVGWIWMPGWESSKLNGFFFLSFFLTRARCRTLSWASVFHFCSQVWCGHSEIRWIQQRKEIHRRGSFYCAVC